MENFEEATRLAEELFAQEQVKKEEQARQDEKTMLEKLSALERVKQQVEYKEMPKVEKQEKLVKQTGCNKMKNSKTKKIHFLIVAYIILIVTELFFYVPYHNIQIYSSKENVPHTAIIGSGYATMANITKDNAYVDEGHTAWASSGLGKIVNTPQLVINVSITTILAIGLYFLLQKKEKKTIEDNEPMPELDLDSLAFADKETQQAEMAKYTQKLTEYIKKKG